MNCKIRYRTPIEYIASRTIVSLQNPAYQQIPCKIIDRLSLAQEYSVGVKSTGQIDEHFPNPRMNRYAALETSLGICASQTYEVPFKIDLIPGQLENFPLAHT